MEEGRLQRLRFIAIITLITKPGHQEFDHRANSNDRIPPHLREIPKERAVIISRECPDNAHTRDGELVKKVVILAEG